MGSRSFERKERYLSAVYFKGVDRLPTSFRASKPLVKRLMSHFGIDPGVDGSRAIEARQELLDRIGADFWSSGAKIGAYSSFVPKYTGPLPQAPYVEDGSKFYTLGIKAVLGRIDEYNFDYPAYADPPLAHIQHASQIKEGFLTNRLDLFDFDCLVNKAATNAGTPPDPNDPLSFENVKKEGKEFICIGMLSSLFMICCYLRGMEQFLIDLAGDIAIAERIISEVGEFCLEFNRRELSHYGSGADFYGTWDDVAGQNGLLFSPKLFKKYFLPLYKDLIANVKQYNLVFNWHCCGSVHAVLPDMIDAGIDVFDVVQTSARDMDLETLNRLYGKDVCFHGGIDVQKLLTFGTPGQIKDEVRKIIDLWGNRGGFVVAPSHEAVPETPVENILAIYDLFR